MPPPSFSIEELAETVARRAESGDSSSYTARLAARGAPECAKKLGEEAIEAGIAAVLGDRAALKAEAADVLYHLLVLLHVGGVRLDDVKAELQSRTARTGLEEKAARRGPV
jgi:phosphoribosyl-ATP pyrophosphohydrolase